MSKTQSLLTLPLFSRLRLVNSSKPLTMDSQYTLINDPHPEIRYKLALRSDTSDAILRVLQNDSKKVQRAIANNPNIKQLISRIETSSMDLYEQERLAHHWNPSVRMALAKSFNTSSSILETMVFDEESRIRRVLAMNPQTPNRTLLQLVNDPSVSVRIKLIDRLDLNDEILMILLKDKSNKVIRQLLLKFRNKILELGKQQRYRIGKNDCFSESNCLDVISLRILHESN